jgi:hypothetical protein
MRTRRYGSPHFKKCEEYDEYKKLEYLHTRPLTAAGLRNVLKNILEVEGINPTKEALGDALCRGSLKYRNFTEEGIQNIYNGWAKPTQRMYYNGWGHFADFLLEGFDAEIGNLQNVDEVYWFYMDNFYFGCLMKQVKILKKKD